MCRRSAWSGVGGIRSRIKCPSKKVRDKLSFLASDVTTDGHQRHAEDGHADGRDDSQPIVVAAWLGTGKKVSDRGDSHGAANAEQAAKPHGHKHDDKRVHRKIPRDDGAAVGWPHRAGKHALEGVPVGDALAQMKGRFGDAPEKWLVTEHAGKREERRVLGVDRGRETRCALGRWMG